MDNDIIKRITEEIVLDDNKLSSGGFLKKKYNFSQVSNCILDDESIPIETKGLYVIIQRWIKDDGSLPTKEFLRLKCNVGKEKFDRMWNELKHFGCLKQYRVSLGKDRFVYRYSLNNKIENNYKSPETYNKKLSKIIKEKYNYTCHRCGEIEKDKAFHVHHIIPRHKNTFINDEKNLVLLCPACHKWVHSKLNINNEYIG